MWIDLVKLSILSSLLFLGQTVVSPILPQYAITFDIPIALTGWAISSFAAARIAVDLPAGIFSDRFNRKKIMIAGLAILSFSSVVAGLAPTYLTLIFARVLSGFGAGLYVTTAISWLAHISNGVNRGKMMGAYSSLTWIGMATGPTVGGFTAASYGIRAPFYVQALVMMVAVLITTQLNEPVFINNIKAPSYWWNDLKYVFLKRSFVLVCFSAFTRVFFNSSFRDTLLPLYSSINLALTEDQIGLLMAAMMMTGGLLLVPAGWISDKIGRKIPIIIYHFLASFIILLVPLQSDGRSLMSVIIVYGVVSGFYGSLHAWPTDAAPPDKVGTAMGVYRLTTDLGFFVGPIAVTYFNDFFNPNLITFPPFCVLSIISIIAGTILIGAADPIRSRKS